MLWSRTGHKNARLVQSGSASAPKIRITHAVIGELRSPAEMRKLLNRKIVEQTGICAICEEEFTGYNDVVSDH